MLYYNYLVHYSTLVTHFTKIGKWKIAVLTWYCIKVFIHSSRCTDTKYSLLQCSGY